jgi:hypothetical protein
MSGKEQKVLIEKVEGGYIVAELNIEAKSPTDLWINKSVHIDFESAVEDTRRRLGISDIIISREGKLSL